MTIINWLRKLGILRFGVEGGVYHNAAERPLSFQDDSVFHSEKDVICFGKKAGQCIEREGHPSKGT